jgi:hypothetical protein
MRACNLGFNMLLRMFLEIWTWTWSRANGRVTGGWGLEGLGRSNIWLELIM